MAIEKIAAIRMRQIVDTVAALKASTLSARLVDNRRDS